MISEDGCCYQLLHDKKGNGIIEVVVDVDDVRTKNNNHMIE
jgi:hypothetical protein